MGTVTIVGGGFVVVIVQYFSIFDCTWLSWDLKLFNWASKLMFLIEVELTRLLYEFNSFKFNSFKDPVVVLTLISKVMTLSFKRFIVFVLSVMFCWTVIIWSCNFVNWDLRSVQFCVACRLCRTWLPLILVPLAMEKGIIENIKIKILWKLPKHRNVIKRNWIIMEFISVKWEVHWIIFSHLRSL